MDILITIIAVIVAALAVLGAFFPQKIPMFIGWVKEGRRLQGVAIVRIVVGVIALYAVSKADIPWLLTTMGLILLASGIVFFFVGQAKGVAICDKMLALPTMKLRFMMLIPLLCASLIILAA